MNKLLTLFGIIIVGTLVIAFDPLTGPATTTVQINTTNGNVLPNGANQLFTRVQSTNVDAHEVNIGDTNAPINGIQTFRETNGVFRIVLEVQTNGSLTISDGTNTLASINLGGIQIPVAGLSVNNQITNAALSTDSLVITGPSKELGSLSGVTNGFVLTDNGPGVAPSFQPASGNNIWTNDTGIVYINGATNALQINTNTATVTALGAIDTAGFYAVLTNDSSKQAVIVPRQIYILGTPGVLVNLFPDNGASATSFHFQTAEPHTSGTIFNIDNDVNEFFSIEAADLASTNTQINVNINGTVKRIHVGAADSGGTGLRALSVVN